MTLQITTMPKLPKQVIMATQELADGSLVPLHGLCIEDRERIDKLTSTLERIADALEGGAQAPPTYGR